jgi:hypothetical protein
LEHSGVPIQPAGQLHWASTVLEEEPQAPGYVIHKLAVWRPTVSMTIWCAATSSLATILGSFRTAKVLQ